MRVVLLFNPISGSGKGEASAAALASDLSDDGHTVTLASTRIEQPETWLTPVITESRAECLVIVGGDGAVRLAAETAASLHVPVYQFPSGTENLFAREFDMTTDVDRLRAALRDPSFVDVDLGLLNGTPFLLMVSVGYDADVVHALSKRRRGAITHASYIPPMITQLLRWDPPRLAVEVDGERIDDGGRGMVLVANCRQYAGRLDPAWRAEMDDGLLDILYMPTRRRRDLLARLIRFRLRHVHQDQATRYVTGREISIRSEVPVHVQLDGDPAPTAREGGSEGFTELSICLSDKKLRVLVPRSSFGG